jgi:hypothetical protein
MTAEHRETRIGTKVRAGERLQLLTVGVLVLATVLGAEPALAKKVDAARDSRLALIRGLAHEVAVAKVALPRGKKGIFLDAQGRVDQEKADAQLRMNGQAIRPGMPVQITKIIFKSNRLIFEVNGGGKKGKKWYQRIQIGVGTMTSPIVTDAPVLAFGSSISLMFQEKMPALTVEQVRRLLGSVLDFERRSPTVLYSPTVPPEIKEAIKKHQVIVGMDHDAVLSAKGPPERKVREVREGVEMEDWIYGSPPHVLFVTFEVDTVVSVRQH